MITNVLNGKQYIGQTSQPLEKRIAQHANKIGQVQHKSLIHMAMQKYGKANFKIEVLEHDLNRHEANLSEMFWIWKFKSIAPCGYNIKSGGSQTSMSNATKKKLSVIAIKRFQDPEKRRQASKAAFERMQRKGAVTSKMLLALKNGREKGMEQRQQNPCKYYRGSNNSNALLKEEQVISIRKEYAAGKISQEALGKKYGVPQVTISAIVRGKNWKHLPLIPYE